MAIRFDPKSAYKHFEEDRLSEEQIKQSMRQPVWFALIDPNDVEVPPPAADVTSPVVLMICKRHPGALNDDLIELLITMDGRDKLVFHAERLTDKWRTYWLKWR